MKTLVPEEWAFWRVPKNELQICFDYELTREAVLQDRERQKHLSASGVQKSLWLEDVVDELRNDARETAQINDFDGWIGHSIHLFIATAYITPVIYSEWPKIPYLSIDETVRSDRAKKLTRPKETDEDRARLLTQPSYGITPTTLYIRPEMTHPELMVLFGGLLRSRFPDQHGGKIRGAEVAPEVETIAPPFYPVALGTRPAGV